MCVSVCVYVTPPPATTIVVLKVRSKWRTSPCTLARHYPPAGCPASNPVQANSLTHSHSLSHSLSLTHTRTHTHTSTCFDCAYIAKRARNGASLTDSLARSAVRAAAAAAAVRRRRRRKGRLSMRTWLCIYVCMHVCVCAPRVSRLCSIIYFAAAKLPGLEPNPSTGKPVRRRCRHPEP